MFSENLLVLGKSLGPRKISRSSENLLVLRSIILSLGLGNLLVVRDEKPNTSLLLEVFVYNLLDENVSVETFLGIHAGHCLFCCEWKILRNLAFLRRIVTGG